MPSASPKADYTDGRRCDTLGFPVWKASLECLLDEIAERIGEPPDCRTLYCLNPHSVVIARRDPAFAGALVRASWLVPDGLGVLLAARLLASDGGPRRRITGSDVFLGLSSRLNERGDCRVFLLGSTPKTLGRMIERMATEWPRIGIAGTASPPFKDAFSDDENEELVSAVNRSGSDVLWVGMTAPKQEIWIDRNQDRLGVSIACAVGAVFDFYAGTVQRPGVGAQRLGLEWAVRLSREPGRLWRRTLVSTPLFVALVASALLKHRLGGRTR